MLEKISQDQVFFRNDGGVTFSGGEPLAQGDFLIEILKKCKQEGIHTAIETTMYASLDYIKKRLSYLDLIYIDLKLFDEMEHKQYTNVSSNIIKDNIRYILTSSHKDKVIIRTPLIPYITANDKNIKNIASFLVYLYSDVRYELLNYNPLGLSKYELLNLEYELSKNYRMFNKDEMEHYYRIAAKAGVKNLIRE